MPLFSIVIPVFNRESYLPACLDSLKNQTLADWEAVVVIDASPDGCAQIARSYAAEDPRFVVIDKAENGGPHLARRDGVAVATGSYVTFLDPDDELALDTLQRVSECLPKDEGTILHFGLRCLGDGITRERADSFESWANTKAAPLNRDELLDAIFSSDAEYGKDWNVDHRVFAASLAKKAFAGMTAERLGRAEDAYETFCLACLSNGEVTRDDIAGYLYYAGRGVTNDGMLSVEKYAAETSELMACADAAEKFAAALEDDACADAAAHLRGRLVFSAANELAEHVSAEDKGAAAQEFVHIVGTGSAAELMRLSRDDAYAHLQNKNPLAEDSDCVVWYRMAVEAAGDAPSERFARYREEAKTHMLTQVLGEDATDEKVAAAVNALGADVVACNIMRNARDAAYTALSSGEPVDETASCFTLFAHAWAVAAQVEGEPSDLLASLTDETRGHLFDVECANGFAASSAANAPTLSMAPVYEAQDVRIFVTTHKNVDLFHSSILQPVQVGAKSPRRRLLWAYQDDAGESIADQNAMYCELTTQYWAWKNADAKYYGFCHYRRYFDFADEEHEENVYGEVMESEKIGWETRARYRLDDDSIRAAVDGYDIVTTGIKDLNEFPEKFQSPIDHYSRAPYLKIADLKRVIDILKETHPDYAQDADDYLAGHFTCFCNMYVMRKELFFRYCEWMFPILQEFVEGWDTTHLSHEALRTPGHLSERLFNIWLAHEKRVNPALKHKQVQCVHFERPDHAPEPRLECADGMGKPVVPVVFAADNNYVPMVTTTVYSMLKNASKDFFYDVVVLEKDFSAYNKRLMSEFFAQFDNASLRFVNVAGMIEAYNLQTSNEHISVETYYRFLIQKVLPGYDKVLYLDSDLIVQGDVSELFATQMDDNLIAAARDIDYLGNLNMNDGERMKYTKEVLELKNPYDYFQAGVLVLNTAEMRKLYPFQKWLEIAAEPKYIYDDQDILNAHCQGRVVYLDNAWNVMNDCGGRIKKVFSFAPADIYDKFMAAYAAPKILHYAGCEKPWKPGPCDLAEIYWMYARETPFYEHFTSLKYASKGERFGLMDELGQRFGKHDRAISENSPLRKVFDGAFPQGSLRRETAKAVVRKLRGRK